jgi:glyoxylase-like metal-dependent hydrolase (beta-lactamase superfamily II)
MISYLTKVLSVLAVIMLARAAPIDARQQIPDPVLFADKWIDGTNVTEPAFQVQALDADTFVIRQSVRTNFEAPFLYLLFGRDRVLLLDTGAGNVAVRPTIDGLISRWLAAHKRRTIPLVVAHSHSHRDHIAGDSEFQGLPNTVLIGLTPRDVARFFGIARWPDQLGRLDLGGRMLTIIPTPGHQSSHIMIYDPRLSIVLSGDALYPGRLYLPIDQFPAARASIDRLALFARTHSIRAVLGAHIEMTATPGRDYEQGAATHPDEYRLELGADVIGELQTALRTLPDDSKIPQVHDRFIVFPLPTRPR